ncbi:MAG: VOC family protein [Planctomycetes bacterium]|nr:VOC family protein [Planctomycetota bacterium]
MDRVCHFEVPFDNKERATKFYRDVFGWQISDAPGGMPYSFAITTPVDEQFNPREPGGINGGMYARGDEGGSKSPVVVIEVESCERRMNDVEKAGGSKVLGPHEIPNMGIYAQVKDSEGNIIGLWQQLKGPNR